MRNRNLNISRAIEIERDLPTTVVNQKQRRQPNKIPNTKNYIEASILLFTNHFQQHTESKAVYKF